MIALLLPILLSVGKPDVTLQPARKIVFLPPGPSPVAVRFRLALKDGGNEDYYCPRIEWEWPDGTRSSEEIDCPPFDEARAADHELSRTKEHEFWEAGTQTIKVRLYHASRLVRQVETKLEVRGNEAPADFQREPR